jgi:type IV pilus biogenesis protein PilP
MANNIKLVMTAAILGVFAAANAAEPAPSAGPKTQPAASLAAAPTAPAATPAAPKRPVSAAEIAAEKMASMQAEIAMLEVQISLEEKKEKLAKLLSKEDGKKPDLNGQLPSGQAGAVPPGGTRKRLTQQSSMSGGQLPTYESIEGVDGNITVNLVMPDGSLRQYGVGGGEQGWKIISIAVNKVVVQNGMNKVTLQKDDGAPKVFNAAAPALGTQLPPPVAN